MMLDSLCTDDKTRCNLTIAQTLQHTVPGDAEQVTADRPARGVVLSASQHRQKRLLDDVVGGIAAAHMRRVAEDGPLEAAKQPGEGDCVAPARQCDQPGTPRLRSGCP